MTVSKVSPGNAKAAKLNVKSAPAKARVEAAAEAKLLADAAHEAAIARTGSPVDAAEGAGGNAALILGGIAVLGGLAAAAAGGGGGDDITVTPAPVTVTPAPTPPPATYALAAGGTSVNEGSSAVFTLTTTNVTAGSPVAYTISGVAAEDVVGGKLTGNATVGADGKAVIEVQLVADATTEGAETLTVTAGGKTASISVADTSLTPAPVAKAFALTAGVDAFVGAATDDTFTADNTGANVTSLADTLDGGAGNDTLTIYGFATGDAVPQTANIEKVVLDNSAAGSTISLVNATGLASVVVQAAAGATDTTVASGVAVTLKANADAATAQVVDYGATATSASLALNGVKTNTGVDVEAQGAAVTTLNITTTGAASTVGQLEVDAAMATVVITGDQNLTITDVVENVVDVIDAHAFTGKLSVKTADENVTFNATAVGGTVDLVDITVKGGSAADTIDVSANLADNELLVEANGGDDTVVIGAALVDAGTTTAGDVLNGGDGVDTLKLTSALAAAQAAVTGVSNFEAVTISDALGANFSAVSLQATGIDTVNLASGGAGTITMAAGSKTVVLKGALTGALGVTDTGTATTDAATISNGLAATNAFAGNNLTSTGYETLTINTTGSGVATAQTIGTIGVTADTGGTAVVKFAGSNSVSTGVITAKTVDASGLTGTATFTNAGATVGVTSITGSANGDTIVGSATATTINAGAGDDTVTGGAGNDTLNGEGGADTITASTGDDTVNGGAGNDVLVFAGNLTYDDTVNGGDGSDVLSITTASVTSLAQTDKVSNVETVRLTGANGTQNLSYFTAAKGFTAVELTALGATLTNAQAGLDLNYTENTAASSFALATATGTSDVVDVNLTSAAAITVGALTVAGVETVNILSDDTNTTAHQNIMTLTAAAATKVTVSGDAGLSLTATGSTAVQVFDASGVTVKATAQGVVYDSLNATVGDNLTITGSAGIDTLTGGSVTNDTINGGTGADTLVYDGAADVFTGGAGDDTFDVNADGTVSAHLTIADLTVGDSIDIATVDDGDTAGVANGALGAKISLGASATLQNYLDSAASNTTDGATANAFVDVSIAKWFQFDGNTYLVVDNSVNATFTAGTDSLVKITGLVDLSTSTFAASVLTIA